MITRRTFSLSLAGAAITTVLVPLQTRAADPVKGGTLIVGAETEIGTRDPAVSESGAAARVNQLIFEGLVARDYKIDTHGAPPRIIPLLAEKWTASPDGLTFTFKLRQGVKFHDGTPFNAEAIEFNVRRVWDSNFKYFYKRGAAIPPYRYRNLKDVKAVDENTVVFTLTDRNAFFIEQLAEGASPGLPTMASPTAVMKYGNDDFGNHPAGTGPFRVKEQVKGQYVTLERNPDYWNKPYPYLDQLIFREIPDTTTRVNALRAGEVDLIISVPPDDVAALKEDGFTIADNVLPHIWYLAFNVAAKPFDDVKLRRAVNMAIDKEGMAKELLRGTASPVFAMVSRSSPAYDANWKDPYPYDVEAAKKLVVDAGYPNGLDTVFEIPTSGSGEMIPVPMAEWIQRDLLKIGIRVKLSTTDWNTYLGHWAKGMTPDVGIDQQSWGSNSDFWMQVPIRSGNMGNSGNLKDPAQDKLLDEMLGAESEADRIKFTRELAERDWDLAYHAPIVSDRGTYAMAAKVKGFIRASDWIEDYSNIWIGA
jgi:peptide/nickel transport system substrate-binding protein